MRHYSVTLVPKSIDPMGAIMAFKTYLRAIKHGDVVHDDDKGSEFCSIGNKSHSNSCQEPITFKYFRSHEAARAFLLTLRNIQCVSNSFQINDDMYT